MKLPKHLHNVLQQTLPSFDVLRCFESEHGKRNVWEIAYNSGVSVLKRFETSRGFQQELAALQTWELQGTPTVLAVFAEEQSLLLSLVEGQSIPLPSLSTQQFLVAGEWLSALHSIPVEDTDSFALVDALQHRANSRIKQLKPHLPTDGWVRLCEILLTLPDSSLLRRVPCHRDFHPRNWLWKAEKLHVVDFEHARMDAWFVDIALLEEMGWSEQQEKAFWKGYGKRPTQEKQRWIHWATTLQAAGSFLWGLRQEDVEYRERGERWLEIVGVV